MVDDYITTFVNRETGMTNTISAACKNLTAYQNNTMWSRPKQAFDFIIITGGSGSGKSRAASEIGNYLRKEAGSKVSVC